MLVLIPCFVGPSQAKDVLPEGLIDTLRSCRFYIAENTKTARRFIKEACPEVVQSTLHVVELDKHKPEEGIFDFLQPALEGNTVGLLSEAGAPGVADPGALVVAMAHKLGILVKPLVGPSSLLLALMASGLNGQNFQFHGYLPLDASARKKRLQELEKQNLSDPYGPTTHLFIETPYRNMLLWETLVTSLSSGTRLCVAVDLTALTEYIRTRTVEEWRKSPPESLHKRPAIFLFLAQN